MSENDGQEEAGGNSPVKIAIFAVVIVLLIGSLVWSMNKSKSLQAEKLPPAKPVDPNAPKPERNLPNLGDLMNTKKPAEAAPAEAAPAEAAPAEAAPAPAN